MKKIGLALLIMLLIVQSNVVKATEFNQYPCKEVKFAYKMPYSGVCLINTVFPDGYASSGTGFMIGKNKVMTAAHVVYSNEHGGHAKSIITIPGKIGNKYPYGSIDFKRCYVSNKFIADDCDGDGTPYTNGTSGDYAIIVLKKNVGKKTGYFRMSTAKKENVNLCWINVHERKMYVDIGKATYGREVYRGSEYTVTINNVSTKYKTSNYASYNYMRHKMNTIPGSSGSPIYFKKGSKYYVVGINVAENDMYNCAVPITKTIKKDISNAK